MESNGVFCIILGFCEKMSLYEVIFIGRQDLSQQQMEALGVSLGLFVEQNAGEIARSEYCGFRELAYIVKKNQKGHYFIMQIKASSETISELDRQMRFNEDIIRYLIVKVDKFESKDNIISQVKSYNDDVSSHSRGGDSGYRSHNNSGNGGSSRGNNIDDDASGAAAKSVNEEN